MIYCITKRTRNENKIKILLIFSLYSEKFFNSSKVPNSFLLFIKIKKFIISKYQETSNFEKKCRLFPIFL